MKGRMQKSGRLLLTTLLLVGLLQLRGYAEGALIGKVFGLVVTKTGSESVQLEWQALSDADGYIVYLLGGTSPREILKTQSASAQIDSIDGHPLVSGQSYTFAVSAYKMVEHSLGTGPNHPVELVAAVGEMSESVTATPTLPQVENFRAEGFNTKTVLLQWDPLPEEASGLIIYKSTKKKSGYKILTTVRKKSATSYKDKKCKVGVVYYYKAVLIIGGNMGAESPVAESATLLAKPKLKKALIIDGNTAQVIWKKVSGAKGYFVFRSTSKNGVYEIAQTVENGSVTSVYVPGQENGKRYFYKICAYGNKKKKKTRSAFSNIKSLTFNLYPGANDDYAKKAKRIFGTTSYQKYATEEEAKSHQKTIRIAVWDFGPDGKTKVTKYLYLTVHENIASTVAQIFKEIYEGEEQFPIKNVGGYSWRGATSRSEHCEGLAIDINWEENYLIDNGTILSGKLYQPGVNPYSIPTNGEVARIMKKYGFSQGIWGNRCDYMHFSFFGT